MASSDITLVIKGDSTKLLTALNKAGAAVDKFSGAAERATKSGSSSFRRLTDAATVAAGTLAAGAISRGIDMITNSVGDAVKRIDTLNNFPKVMGNVGISADKARAAIKRATDGIMGLPTSLDTAAQSIQRLTMKTKDVDKATDLFLALNNAILAGGAAPHIQAAAMEQLSQAFARGKPDLMEWRTAMTAAPAQMDQLAKAMGKVDALALYEDIKDGKISMDQLGDALVRLNTKGAGGLPTFAKQAKNATGGIATGMENAKTAVVRGVAKIIEAMGAGDMSSGFGTMGLTIEKLLNKIAVLVKFVKENQTAFTILGGVMGTVILSVKVYDFWTRSAAKATAMWTSAKKLFSKESKTAAVAIKLFNAATKAAPIFAVIGAIGALTAGFVWLWNNVEGFRNFFIGAWGGMRETIRTIEPAIKAIVSAVSGVASTIGDAIFSAAKIVMSVVGAIIKVVSTIGTAVWKIISPIVDVFSKVFGFVWRIVSSTIILIVAIVARLAEAIFMAVVGIVKVFIDNFSTIASFIGGILQGISSVFVNTFSSIASFVGGIINTVAGFFSGLFSSIVQIMNSISSAITEAVSVAISVVMTVVSPIVGWIDGVIVAPIASLFSGLWAGVVSKVSWFVNAAMSVIAPIAGWINGNVIQPVARFFGSLWDGVVGGVRAAVGTISNAMGSIAGFVKAPINGVIGAINRVVDIVNGFSVPDWVPVLGGKKPNFPKIPRLATGGIVGPQGGGSIIYAGDGGQNEWVVPESKMASLVDQINKRRSSSAGNNVTINNTYHVRDNIDIKRISSDLGYLLSQA